MVLLQEGYSHAKTIKQRCFKVRWGGGEGNLPKVWKFSLSLKTPTLEEIEGEEIEGEEIEGEELVYI
jgi:hypothetical protein